jgi:hypothetical protein
MTGFSARLPRTISGWSSDSAYLTLGPEARTQRLHGPGSPTLRPIALVAAAAGQTFWASVSRAVRTPSLAENSLAVIVPVAPPSPRDRRSAGGAASERQPRFRLRDAHRLPSWATAGRCLRASAWTPRFSTTTTIAFAPSIWRRVLPGLRPLPTPRLTVRGAAGNNLEGETLASNWPPTTAHPTGGASGGLFLPGPGSATQGQQHRSSR